MHRANILLFRFLVFLFMGPLYIERMVTQDKYENQHVPPDVTILAFRPG